MESAKLIVEVAWGLAPSMIQDTFRVGMTSTEWEFTPDDQKWMALQHLIDEGMRKAREQMEAIPSALNYVRVEVIWL